MTLCDLGKSLTFSVPSFLKIYMSGIAWCPPYIVIRIERVDSCNMCKVAGTEKVLHHYWLLFLFL